ncbi:hypothetical protein JCM16303_006117 [Sporobolomyces ruberrimus]
MRRLLDLEEEQIQLGKDVLGDNGNLCSQPSLVLDMVADMFVREYRAAAVTIVEQLSRMSSPKELILGIEGRLAELKCSREADTDESDDESDDRERREGKDSKTLQSEAAVCALATYVRAYGTSLKRLVTTKQDLFYSSAFDAISSTFTHLVVDGALEREFRSPIDLILIEAIFELASQVESIEKEGQRQSARVKARALVETVVGLSTSAFRSSYANDFFLSLHPKYRMSEATSLSLENRARQTPHIVRASQTKHIWTDVFPTLYKNLDYQLDDLLVDCRYSDALKQIGSFSFLSHFLALNPATPISAFDIDEDMQATPSFLLSAVLGTIQSSYGPFSPYKLAEDDILFFLWWCVDQQTKSEEEMAAGFEADAMFELVHVLTLLSAASPNPQTRFLAFRLLSTLVLDHTGASPGSDSVQMPLLKNLLTHIGTPATKTACLEIVKEVLARKLDESEKDPDFVSLFLTPDFIEEFGPIILRGVPPDIFKTLSPDTFLAQFERDVSQKLNLYYFLLTRDKENKTGIRSTSTLQDTKEQFLDPLKKQLSSWLDPTKTEKLNPSVSLELELVQSSLSRIDELLKALA